MTLRLEHVLVPVRDQERSACFLADLLGLHVTGESSGSPAGHFAVVRVEDITIDFGTIEIEQFDPHHLAFAVDDVTFDAVIARICAAGIEYTADPTHQRPGELNDKRRRTRPVRLRSRRSQPRVPHPTDHHIARRRPGSGSSRRPIGWSDQCRCRARCFSWAERATTRVTT